MENEEISFGPFWLDLRRPELRRDGQPVRIYRRPLGILCALAEAKGEIVSKAELMARLWPGRVVEEGNLHVHVSALRKALEEHDGGHSLVATVPGRGYRLADLSGEAKQECSVDGIVEGISLGRFRLDLGRRELLRDGRPVRIHWRAYGLIALSKREASMSIFRHCARRWTGMAEGTILSLLFRAAVTGWQIRPTCGRLEWPKMRYRRNSCSPTSPR